MSFCIMFTLNHASSGICSTNGPAILHHGRSDRAVRQNVHRHFARDAAFFRQQHAFGERQHLHHEAELVAIFITSARPFSPTCVTFGPMSSSSGLTRSNVSLRPPTMTESLPCWSVITLPETGASTMSAPFARTFSASALAHRRADGAHVDQHLACAQAQRACRSGLRAISSSAAELVTIESVTSARFANAARRIGPLHALIDQPLRLLLACGCSR